MRGIPSAATVLLLAGSLAASPAYAKGHRAEEDGPDWKGTTETTHTVTWWCVDLNELFHVEVPVVIGRVWAIPPDPSPIPNPCANPFPVPVPAGSAFTPITGWFTNTTYPPAVRAALESIGYQFHSESPAEDLMRKLAEIRVEVRTFPDDDLVAEYRFDPRQNFRLVRVREFYGILPIDPIVDPGLGIDLSSAEIGRMPLFGFPVIAGPVEAGSYRALVFWRVTALHNDGLGLGDDSFLPEGEFLYIAPRFIVLP